MLCDKHVMCGTCPYDKRCKYIHDRALASSHDFLMRRSKHENDCQNKETGANKDSFFWPNIPKSHSNCGGCYDVSPSCDHKYYFRHRAVFSIWRHFRQFCVNHNAGAGGGINGSGGAGAIMWDDSTMTINQYTCANRLSVFVALSNGVSPQDLTPCQQPTTQAGALMPTTALEQVLIGAEEAAPPVPVSIPEQVNSSSRRSTSSSSSRCGSPSAADDGVEVVDVSMTAPNSASPSRRSESDLSDASDDSCHSASTYTYPWEQPQSLDDMLSPLAHGQQQQWNQAGKVPPAASAAGTGGTSAAAAALPTPPACWLDSPTAAREPSCCPLHHPQKQVHSFPTHLSQPSLQHSSSVHAARQSWVL